MVWQRHQREPDRERLMARPGHVHRLAETRLRGQPGCAYAGNQSADLTQAMLASARKTVASWRHQVADWAESPSRPIPAQLAETIRDALGALDTTSLLALLHDLAQDADVPAGAKFETFLYADRVLGLDLPRDIGRVRG